MRPVRPKNTPTFTGAVCDIIRMYVVALIPSVVLSVIIRPKSAMFSGVPAEDP